MELAESLRKRRAVRDYSDVPLKAEVVKSLIEAATLAPSAMNLQPWAFAALLDRKRINEYGERIKGWLLKNFSKTGLDPSLRETIKDPQYSIFHHAPALILVVANSSGRQSAEDCCLAAENLMLAARDAEIGTCWIGLARPWLNQRAIKKELGLAEGCEVVAPIVLGYPKGWPEPHGRRPPQITWLG
jgi:nitroreductase